MRLYRIDETKTVGASDAYTYGTVGHGFVPGGALVLVEPCEHGNYATHIDLDDIEVTWCPGAGVLL